MFPSPCPDSRELVSVVAAASAASAPVYFQVPAEMIVMVAGMVVEMIAVSPVDPPGGLLEVEVKTERRAQAHLLHRSDFSQPL